MSESDGIESEEEKEKETLNAFHIISLSEGFDLSPLFGERKKEEEMRFATAAAASRVIEKMEEVGKAAEFSVRKSESKVRLVGNESGRKGKLAIEAETFAVTAALTVVEVKKGGGDTFEYNQFCSKELRPALTDIVWIADKSVTA
ncbi:CBL-interacting serine/threonine-protein kinase 6 [Camellia lanceoleosa]|uniref:CBL-interacting serine/threonine-protein kinase 6 n=1 Tax=Camellia lanceoleosa TaxID=1840588 RepID=A0ACC0FD97_9ERIC|nr:CBL-interacting serine/threonine-protein kinase 6 [Camellia lanceoleosa]